MHYDFPHWSTWTKTYNDNNARANSEIPRKDGEPSRLSESGTVEIPAFLQGYLTTTSRPNEIYSQLHESRQRRLRLLLRRFTNQIQFGCKNPFCNVPSCFSYRKRRTDVPVRPYTDVAARALAWRYVEEYSNSANVTKPDTSGASTHKFKYRKTSAPCERGNGLCWNEPVVPWYADPKEYVKKRKPSYTQSSIPVKATDEQPHEHNSPRMRVDPRGLSQINGSFVKSNKHSTDANENKSKHPCQTFIGSFVSDAQCKTQTHESHGAETTPHCHGTSKTLTPASKGVSNPPIDTASFSQSLFSTDAAQSLDEAPQAGKSVTTQTSSKCGHGPSATDQPGNLPTTHAADSIEKSHIDSLQPTYTFRILDKVVIGFLETSVRQQPYDKITFNEGPEATSVTTESLARQSIHYCLSHPLRLLESAEMWRLDLKAAVDAAEAASSLTQPDRSPLHQKAAQTELNSMATNTVPALPTLEDAVLTFGRLSSIQSYSLVLDSVFAALQHAYVLPHILHDQYLKTRNKAPRGSDSSKRNFTDLSTEISSQSAFIDDQRVASLCVVGFYCLFNWNLQAFEEHVYPMNEKAVHINHVGYQQFGKAWPHAYMSRTINLGESSAGKDIFRAELMRFDVNDDLHVQRLLVGLTDVISHRLALKEILKTVRSQFSKSRQGLNIVDCIINHLCESKHPDPDSESRYIWLLMDLMYVVLSQRWDKKTTIQRRNSVGGALEMLAGLYRRRTKLKIPVESFVFRFIAEALDTTKMPLEWLSFREDAKQTHILSFSFLFKPSDLVKYFRAINIEIMRRSYEYASVNQAYAKNFLMHQHIPVFGAKEVLDELRPHMARQFMLTVRRQHILEDAINQIWRRQHQELMRPLKVSLGKDEGEDGLDHGGVQQEFFRMLFAEALDISYGMFTIDDQTYMTWFQPGSLEPLYKFEALGILMSLAVYNCVTLPITFPLAFYRKLLGLKVKHLEHIEDGWPELAKGLRVMQTWNAGDVGEVMARTYEFSYRVVDQDVTVDMSKIRRCDQWPSSGRRKSKDKGKTATFETSQPSTNDSTEGSRSTKDTQTGVTSSKASGRQSKIGSIKVSSSQTTSSSDTDIQHSQIPRSPLAEDPPLVTNANRDQYIKDYIFWLTDKSIAPQFEAFYKGFHTCLDSTALSIFTPEALKTVIEGHTEIDIDGLEACATYDDFRTTDQIIIDLWSIIRDMSTSQHKQLLEFVTASDRVPVTGISSVTFIIQKNGEGDERLPSSSTCYGRLLLPMYSSKEILRAKLEKAIENSVGFGTL